MSQRNDPPAPCTDKGGHDEATNSLLDALRSGVREQNKQKLSTVVAIVDRPMGKKNKSSWVWKVMRQLPPPTGKCSVRCTVEISYRWKIQPCGALFAWSGLARALNTRKPHQDTCC